MKRIIFLILFVIFSLNIYSQLNVTDDLLKYWYYRNRLQYFVVPGDKQGESEIIGIRNDMTDKYDVLTNANTNPPYSFKDCTNGQHGVYFGYYLGVLATEYYMLSQNNQNIDATNTDNELYLALQQFQNYMDKNDYWGVSEGNNDNGFFVRDNVPCGFMNNSSYDGLTSNGEYHLNLLNKGLTTTNIWDENTNSFHSLPQGHPGYSDYIDGRLCGIPHTCDDGNAPPTITKEPMSIDEVVGVLLGLALVEKLGSANARSTAETIACNIISYAQLSGILPWTIWLPNGQGIMSDACNSPGSGDVVPYSYPMVKASRYFDNSCVLWDPISSSNLEFILWQAQQLGPNPVHDYNDWMAATLAAIGKSWVIGIPITIGICPFCIHFTISIPSTGMGISNVTTHNNSEAFYLLLYEILHNTSTSYLDQYYVNTQINEAPCEGPYNYQYNSLNGAFAPNGWATSYKWRYETEDQNGQVFGDATGNFNGLDYMLDYNLEHILEGNSAGYYMNYNDLTLSGTLPYKDNSGLEFATLTNPANYLGFNSITSTQLINNFTSPVYSTDPGNVTYKAGNHIELKPGFHASNGAYFHACIGNFTCSNGGNYARTTEDSSYLNNTSPLFGSLLNDTIPQTPYPLTPENIEVIDTLPCGKDTLHFNGISLDTTITMYDSLTYKDTTISAGHFSYQWNFGNGQISREKKVTVIYGKPGTYHCQLILTYVPTGVIDTMRFGFVVPVCNTTQGSKITNPQTQPPSNAMPPSYYVSVYPNPNNGNMQISYIIPNDETGVFELYDILGEKLLSYSLNGGMKTFAINSSILDKGVYFYQVYSNNKLVAKDKIVIIK